MTLRTALPLLLVFSFACDKGQQPPPNPPQAASDAAAASGDGSTSPGGSEDTEPVAPGVPWHDKALKQRQEDLGNVVVAKMKQICQAHDEVDFKGCKREPCHGDDMKGRNFELPTDSIYPLPKENTIQAAMDYDAKTTKFMIEQVVPEMAKLLDEEPYDPETQKGHFGCFSCHPSE